MATEPVLVVRKYSSSFCLDQPKLSRIVNIVEEKFAGHNIKFENKFEVTHSNAKNINLNGIDELLRLDNTIRNPITSLTMRIAQAPPDNHEACIISYDNSMDKNISLSVSSADAKFANQIFAEAEEQIERTFLSNWIYKLRRSKEIIPLIVGIIASLIALGTSSFLSSSTKQDIKKIAHHEYVELANKAKQINTTEDKINFLFEISKHDIESKMAATKYGSSIDISKFFDLKFLFISTPILIIIGCIIYLFVFCYPHSVFMWGDYGDYYQLILSRRRMVWTVIIASLFLGVLSNLFVLGLAKII